MAKEPYRASNKKNYGVQVCLILDRQDKIASFAMYIEWKRYEAAAAAQCEHPETSVLVETPEAEDVADWQLSTASFLPFARAFIPRSVPDSFMDDP